MTVGKHAHPLKVARELDDFNSRLDRQAAAAIRDLFAQRDHLVVLLRHGRAVIEANRDGMVESHTDPVTGLIDDDQARMSIESDTDLLTQIDAAIYKAGGAA